MLVVELLPFNFSTLQMKFPKLQFKSMEHTKDSRSRLNDINIKIEEIISKVNMTIPNIYFEHIENTTDPKKSKVTILDYKTEYCVGDPLTVHIEMFDFLGQKKIYGGDLLRARIFSQSLGAGVSGKIIDFNNGTYHVQFSLFWEGSAKVSILLMHPSEGVSALWRARNLGYKYIMYTGKFLNKTKEIHTECGFDLDDQDETCKYEDKRYGEVFYCIKPPNVPCEKAEKNTAILPKCTIGMSLPFPSGYFLNNAWFPLYCNLSSYYPLSQIDTCLSGKMIYLMGDSTIRQWIEYFPKVMKTLKFFDVHESGWHKKYIALDMERNIRIQWKKHGHPFVTQSFFTVKDYASVPNEIDRLAGGPHTVIVIALGQHFRPFPVTLFIRRLLNVRDAVERLFLRSPDTKIIIRSENTREQNPDVERFSDFHGYVQYLLVKDIFQGLNVGVIDAWDMTTAFGSFDVHPPEIVIKNQINLFLSYILGPILPTSRFLRSLSLRSLKKIQKAQSSDCPSSQTGSLYRKRTVQKFWRGHIIPDPQATLGSNVPRTWVWWPTYLLDVRAWVQSCSVCVRMKTPRNRPIGLFHPLPVLALPWTHLSMDFMVDLPPSSGNTTVLVVIDRFSKQGNFVPLPKLPTAAKLAEIFFSETNGQTERLNQNLEHYLRPYCNYHQNDWSTLLSWAELSYNSLRHSSLGCSPFFAALGYNPHLLLLASGVSLVPAAKTRVRSLTDHRRAIRAGLLRA
ncbi:NXPE family member 1-like [Rhinophrynus dorsalis]